MAEWAEAGEAIRVAQYPAPTTLGDYNSNGVVDAADYVVWRSNLGSDFSLQNDDSPGVDDYDYTRWRMNFGEVAVPGAGQLAAVPEPASLGLFMLGLWCLFVWARGEQKL